MMEAGWHPSTISDPDWVVPADVGHKCGLLEGVPDTRRRRAGADMGRWFRSPPSLFRPPLNTLMRIFEDEATDQQARDAAVSVYDGLVKWLPGNLQALKPAEDFHFDLEAYPGSLILPFEDQKLVIVFEPSGGKPNVGDENGWIGIFLPFLRTPGDPTGVDRMLAANKIEFVHEYIHFLLKRREEMSRERSQQKHQRSDGQFPEDGKPAYYNHPQETNAYYQEAAIRMADRIKALHPDDRAKLARDKTDDLVRWAYQFFSRPFLKNLTDDNKRKLVKRLARYVEQSLRPALRISKSDR